MLIQQLRRQIANLIAGKYFPPPAVQQTQACHRTFFVEIGYFPIAMEAANCTVNFYEASPPNCELKSPQMRLRLTTRGFVNTQGN
jgi:hypothetical protein